MSIRRQKKKNEKALKADENGPSLKKLESKKKVQREKLTSEMIDELKKGAIEREEFKERLQRASADFSNYQKRAQREIEENKKYSAGSIALDLLSVVDNFDRAIEAARDNVDHEFLKGVKMIMEQLKSTLQKHGVKVIEAKGELFDPNYHDALLEVEDETQPDKTVVDELEKGYMIHDRLLRPTRVRVSRIPDKDKGSKEEDSIKDCEQTADVPEIKESASDD